MSDRPLKLVIVEDNLADAKLTSKLFARCEAIEPEDIFVAMDGEVAWDYLRGDGEWSERRLPDLVFMDLNVPKLGGLEVLERMRDDDELKRVPVIIMSSSSAPDDVSRAHELHANAFVQKPCDLRGLEELIRSIEGFWFQACCLP